jgi:hypothetical protein
MRQCTVLGVAEAIESISAFMVSEKLVMPHGKHRMQIRLRGCETDKCMK